MMQAQNRFEEFFWNQSKTCIVHKWHHYLKIYHHHFSRFIDKNPVILEIGMGDGGSAEMWNYYFEGKCTIYGVDVAPACLKIPERLQASNIFVELGDQGDAKFWQKYLTNKPKFDVVIDDGGHMMHQQIVAFEQVYDHVSDEGVYLCEDLHTSYMQHFGGGLKKEDSFIEYSKNFIDELHTQYFGNKQLSKFRQMTESVHYYDSVIALEKGKRSMSVATRH